MPGAKAVKSSGAFDVDWRNSVGYLLRDVTRSMLRITAANLAPYGITLTQYFVLRTLWDADPPSQRELAQQLAIPESAVATLLDDLGAAGLVVRKRSTIDRRRTHVHLTPAAEALRPQLLRYGMSVLNGALAGVPASSVTQFRRTLTRMKANLEAIEGRD